MSLLPCFDEVDFEALVFASALTWGQWRALWKAVAQTFFFLLPRARGGPTRAQVENLLENYIHKQYLFEFLKNLLGLNGMGISNF